MSAELNFIDGVELVGGIKISNVSALGGDVLWAETASPLYSDVVISMLLGLMKPLKGNYLLASGQVTNKKQKQLISYFDATWDVGVRDAESFAKMIALNYDQQMSAVSSEFKRIIKGLGAEYALKVKFEDLKPATKSIVSTAATLALPLPVVLLKEPYYGLEKHAAEFLSSELLKLSKDGSLIIVFAESTPAVYTKQVQIIEEF